MQDKFKKLFEESNIGSMKLKNRIVYSPMTTMLNDAEGNVSEYLIDYYEERAKGGAGLIMTDACFPNNAEHGPIPEFHFTASNAGVMFSKLAESVHKYGSKLCIQVSAGSGRTSGVNCKSASAVPILKDPNILTTPLTKEEIQELIDGIVAVCLKAVIAGADAINIHAHNGYMIDQFMSPQWNKREDEYGGSAENRMRFATELIAKIRATVGPHIPIIFRITIEQKYPGGRTYEDTLPLLKILEEAGVDAFDVDTGVYESMDYMFPSYYLKDTPHVHVAKRMKEDGISLPILCSGNHTADTAADCVNDGTLDFVMFGRPMIADPQLPNKIMNGEEACIKPCIRCNEYCVKGALTQLGLKCAVNAQAGSESRQKIVKTDAPKKVVVVGGGPAGLEAATVAAMKGHKVSLYEKSDVLGGLINAAATPDFKTQLRALIDYYRVMMDKLDIDVHYNTEINAESSELKDADQIIIAVGSNVNVPPITGIEKTVDVVSAHLDRSLVKGNNIVVCGGGLSGCDFALEEAQNGKNVTVIEMFPKVAKDVFPINAMSLFRELAMNKVTLLPGNKVVSFDDTGVNVNKDGEIIHIDADTCVNAFGNTPNSKVVADIKRVYPYNTRAVGDCDRVNKVGEAIRNAFYAASSIE